MVIAMGLVIQCEGHGQHDEFDNGTHGNDHT